MELLKRRWTIYLVHHTHTDLGYTDLQVKLARDHAEFIEQALGIIEVGERGNRPEWQGFKWTCECFWSIEQFLRTASPAGRQRLAHAIERGSFGLSGTYLHFNELIDDHLLRCAVARAADFGREIGQPVECALSADINGFSWGYAQALFDHGIRNLATCVHGHHGMPPLGHRQLPFYWVTPKGDEVLVWNGEHYNLGNVLGLCPGGLINFMFHDEFGDAPRTKRYAEIAEVRLSRYLAQLERDEYPYSFVPIMVSGTASDNAPPNPEIATFVAEWNSRHGSSALLHMSTLEDFFKEVRASDIPIPHVAGDWPDWWSDGVGSSPQETRLYRHAQREYRYFRELSRNSGLEPSSRKRDLEQQLLLFAEHTFGHSDSITLPWNPLVQAVGACKKAHAANACALVGEAMDEAFSSLGETPYTSKRGFRFRVMNAMPWPIDDHAAVIVEHQEFWQAEREAIIVDVNSGAEIPSQKEPAPRGYSYRFPVQLAPGENKDVELRPRGVTVSVFRRNFPDGVEGDVAGSEVESTSSARAVSSFLETPYVKIAWEPGAGVTEWTDLATGISLVSPRNGHSPFTPVYERTRAAKPEDGSEALRVRNRMGRNRKGPDVERHVGVLREALVIDQGPVFATVELRYDLPGASMFAVQIRAFATSPRVEVDARIHKHSVWDPENLYVALPFRAPTRSEEILWVEKAGAQIRPRIDQLPDTTTDFLCLQEGLALVAADGWLAVGMPDSPLLQLGPLEHGKRLLQGNTGARNDNACLYAWVMNNYWETNFDAVVGGFHEFRFHVAWGTDFLSAEEVLRRCGSMNIGVKTFRLRETS